MAWKSNAIGEIDLSALTAIFDEASVARFSLPLTKQTSRYKL